MKVIHRMRLPLVASSLMVVAGVCFGGQAGRNLVINGHVASTDLRTIDGRTYVPLADVAKALNMTLTNKPGSIEMTLAGGANQVAGLRGKIGEDLFTGKWRLTAKSISQVDTYTTQYEGDKETYTPRTAGETLYVVSFRIKNAQNDPMEMVFTQRVCGHTALADDQSHSYAPMGYDAHNETGPYGGPKLLPGAAAEFAVIFSAPKGTVPKDIIFSIISGSDLSHTKEGNSPGVDLRISAKE